MMQTEYRVTMGNGFQWTMTGNMSEASASLGAKFFDEDDEVQPTPYQTADAQHWAETAAKLVWDYFAEDEDERMTKVASVK